MRVSIWNYRWKLIQECSLKAIQLIAIVVEPKILSLALTWWFCQDSYLPSGQINSKIYLLYDNVEISTRDKILSFIYEASTDALHGNQPKKTVQTPRLKFRINFGENPI